MKTKHKSVPRWTREQAAPFLRELAEDEARLMQLFAAYEFAKDRLAMSQARYDATKAFLDKYAPEQRPTPFKEAQQANEAVTG